MRFVKTKMFVCIVAGVAALTIFAAGGLSCNWVGLGI